MTVSGLSALFKVHKRTIQMWAADRGIPLIRIGNLMIFDIDDVKGWLLQHNGSNYTPVFIVCGLAYVTALLVIQLLVPRVERVPLGDGTAA